jgi:hypothetical protein
VQGTQENNSVGNQEVERSGPTNDRAQDNQVNPFVCRLINLSLYTIQSQVNKTKTLQIAGFFEGTPSYLVHKFSKIASFMYESVQTRDSHRFFMLELIGDLLNKRWMDEMDSQTLMVGMVEGVPGSTPKKPQRNFKPSPSPQCDSYASRNVLARLGKTSRDARGCAVCKHEGRYPTTMTDYCSEHKVCLCRKLYTRYEKNNEGFYSETLQESEDFNYEWSCWEKYHSYYLPKKLFNLNRNIIKNSEMHLESKRLRTERAIQRKARKLQLDLARRAEYLNILPPLFEEFEECQPNE